MKKLLALVLAALMVLAGVAALAARAAIRGAHLNGRINAGGPQDRTPAEPLLERAAAIEAEAEGWEQKVLEAVDKNL